MLKKIQHTQAIVIVGFIIVISLSTLGIFLIYKELVKFSEVSDTTEERKELVSISNILVSLYKTEGTANMLMIENIPKVKTAYDNQIDSILSHIHHLREISKEPYLLMNLDSISILLHHKKKNSTTLRLLVDSIENKTSVPLTHTVFSPQNTSDLDQLISNTISDVKQSEDTVVSKVEKKGVFKRIKDAITDDDEKNLSTTIFKNQQERIRLEIILTDTITHYIRNLVKSNKKRDNHIIRELLKRQTTAYQTNEKLTTQINQIMREIEKKEFQTTLHLMKEKEFTFRRSSNIVATIGILALLTTLLFVILTIRSLAYSQQYRKEIENANNYTKGLLASRERLIMTITHDIKAPLSSIIGYLELLSKSKLPEKEQYYLENMQNSAEHVLQLVKNLLDYYSLYSNKQEINHMSFAPYTLLKDICQSFIPLAYKKGIKLNFESDIDNASNFKSDPYRIRQIVSNLLSNAIKFTPENGSVILSAQIKEKSGKNMLIFSVKDTGLGISKEDQKCIFDEFTRLDNNSGKVIEGSGLGLAITNKLVHFFKGSIDIISSYGKGSEFIVHIPITKKLPSTTKLQKKEVTEIGKKLLDRNTYNKKILFIDDDVVQLNLVSEILKKEGFSPTVCANSIDALDLLQKNRFDIVFSDIQMPDMNGFELVERIRLATFERAMTIPVIALSASSNISEQKFKEAGFSGFLSKPFSSKQLTSLLLDFLGEGIGQCSSYESEEAKGFTALINFVEQDKRAGEIIIQSFIKESNKDVTILKRAFEQEDWDTVKSICHKMLPLMRMISAEEVVHILCEYEKGSLKKENSTSLIQLIEIQIQKAESFLISLKKA